MEPESTYQPGAIDKIASKIIAIFLGPIRAMRNRSKKTSVVPEPAVKTAPAVTASQTAKTTDDKSGLTEKAVMLEKSSKLPKLPSGIPTKKIVLAIGVLVFVLILLNLVLGLLKRPPTITGPTPVPTTTETEPSQPSIYADDEDVLSLEERIKVLDRELSNVVLRDTTMKPPILDFNINF
ncbi:hypothetical protein ACFL2C_03780 [Patescibacteria group bacterium]